VQGKQASKAINHSTSLRQMCIDVKNLFTTIQNDIPVVKQSPHLKCVATLSCDLSLSLLCVSDYHCFLTLMFQQVVYQHL